jgi:hypothetical protein
MQTEPPLNEIQSGGRLSLALLGRLVRRVEHLQEKLDDGLVARSVPAPPRLQEPSGKTTLNSAYLKTLVDRIENAWAEISAVQFTANNNNPEPPLNPPPYRGQLRIQTINRIIRRIEYLHSLEIGGGS